MTPSRVSLVCFGFFIALYPPLGAAAIELALDGFFIRPVEFPAAAAPADAKQEEAYEALGRELARDIGVGGQAGTSGIGVYRVRSLDYRLGADILVLDGAARHPNNLESLIAGYVKEAFREPRPHLIARRILWYNANVRRNAVILRGLYCDGVNARLHLPVAGIETDAQNWPGPSELLLPTSPLVVGGSEMRHVPELRGSLFPMARSYHRR